MWCAASLYVLVVVALENLVEVMHIFSLRIPSLVVFDDGHDGDDDMTYLFYSSPLWPIKLQRQRETVRNLA